MDVVLIANMKNLKNKISNYFSSESTGNPSALKILLLDLTLLFSKNDDTFADLIESPLGLMYLLTYLNKTFGDKIKGLIAKAKVDFDNYEELKTIIDKFNPDIIGIRTISMYKNFFHETVAKIRQWGVEVPIISRAPMLQAV